MQNDMNVYSSCLLYKWIFYYGYVFIKGTPIVLHEVTAHWMDSLISSSNKKDAVFMHVKGPGLHFYAPTGYGGKKYMCAPGAKFKSHQRYFQKDTTRALYKHCLHQYPLCRGVYCRSPHLSNEIFSSQCVPC